jgi:excisionase family DNA binding protein
MKAERITIEAAAAILGVPLRNVYGLASKGELPGAAKIGKRWTFDEAKLRSWVREREATTSCLSGKRRKTATGGVKSSGVGSRLPVRNTDGAYEQRMQQLRNGGSRPVARN